jgi:Response regulator containing a CheY-like receiver domain and an HD-GYP domain
MILTKLKTIINKWTTPPALTTEDGIRYWQDRVIFILLLAGLIPGFLVYLPSVALSIKEGLWGIAFIDTVLYTSAAILFFKRTISSKTRAICIVLLSYIIGMTLMLVINPYSAGPIWIFAFPVVAAALMGFSEALVALAVNAVTLIIFGILMYFGYLGSDYITINPMERWLVIALNFIFLNILVTFIVSGILWGFQDLFEKEIIQHKQREDERQQNMDRLHKALEGTVSAIGAMIETRDPYTAGHQRRVSDLAGTIAAEMGLAPDQIDGIRMASMIHDIGKIVIPAEILCKAKKLTEIELSLVRDHVRAGYDILKDIEFTWPVARMVLEHHEKLDGSGYPRNLSGQEILLESSIITVADVVESMASHRPYRPSLGINAALDEIAKNRGTLYSPDVVDACLRLFNEKGYKMVA